MPSSVDMTSGVDATRDTTPSLPRKPAFKATRLTFSTFVIKEYADSYDEHPLIYAKICSEIATIVIIDTGCGGTTKDPDIDLKSLRQFVETVPVEENDGEPLNKGSEMRFVVVLSHCHYDHILGVEEFSKDSQILASGYLPAFLDPDTLPTHSLCKFLDIPVPSYKPILVPHDYPIRMNNDHNGGGLNPWTGLRVLHTPGHTPDELAVWDAGEHMLYVGDTLYEWEPIIFPAEGSITAWLKSVDELLQLINDEEAGGVKEVKISCGHVTAGQSAREVVTGAKAFIVDVLEEKQPVRRRSEKRGEAFVEYAQEGHRFSLACPERLIQEARQTLSQSEVKTQINFVCPEEYPFPDLLRMHPLLCEVCLWRPSSAAGREQTVLRA